MIYSKSLYIKLSIAALALLLTACASLEGSILAKLQTLEDSIRGYRVQYDSIPVGATIECNGQNKGVAPFYKYYDLTTEQKKNNILSLDNCQALWPSGARTDVPSTIPLDQFPNFVHMLMERPSEAPDYEIDVKNGVRILAERQKLLDNFSAAVGGTIALGADIQRQNKALKGYSGYESAQINPTLDNNSSHGRINWNWVQGQASSTQLPGVQPNFGIVESAGNKASLTPVFPAASCVGTILVGKCYGKIMYAGIPQYCSGQMADGKCNGAVLFGD
jgi:hypothetical protein